MSQFIDYINQFPVNQTANTTTNTSITTEIINPQQQVTSRGIVTGQIFKDVQNIRNQKSIESGESQVIIQNSVNMLSLITAQPAFIDEYIAQSSIVIIRKIQEVIEVTPRLLQSDEGFKENLGITLSNLLKFAQNKREALNKGRRLFNTTTDEGLNAIFDQIRALKNSYAQLICESINPDSIQQSLSTDTFTLKLERFSKYSSVELRSFLATENPKTRVTLRVKDLIHTLSASDPNFDSFCVHVTYFKVPMKPSSLYEQYSESQIDFELPGYDTVNFKPHMRMLLELEPVSYRSNQTVCMAYLNVAQSWSQEVCETSINEDTLEIECKCNMIDTLYYGLFTDASRKFGESLKIQKEKATSNTSQSSSSMRTSHTQSVAYIGILMLLLIFGLVIPASIYALDRKDKKAAMERKLNSQQNQQINLIARLSNYPQEYWQAHFETVMNYSLQGKSLISHLFAHVHPYLSLFTFYDPLQPRLTRHLFPLLQTSFFALTCILVFSPSYRQLDTQRLDSSLDQTDLDLILLIGAIGMVALLPIPYTQSLFRQTPQKQKVKLRVIQQQEAHKTQPDCTSEQQINQHSPVQILQTHHRVTSSNPMQAQYKPEEEASATAFNPQLKYLPLQIVLALVSIGTFIAALSLLIYQLPQLPASNQYCLLASMYIGVFGNLFLVQPARVFINTLLAHKALINKRIRFIVSAETVRVVQEIAWVREAEHQKECVEDVKPIVKEKNEVKESLMNQTVANNHRQQTDSEDLCIFAGQIPNNSDASKQLDELVVHSQSESPNRRSKGGILSGLGDYQAKKNPLLFSQGFESLRKGPDQKYSGIKEDSMIKQQINSTQEE